MARTSSTITGARRRSPLPPAARVRTGSVVVAVAALASLAAGCGGSGHRGGHGDGAAADGKAAQSAERGFLQAMVPHHESAIEMARVALRRAEHPETERLARDIVEAQQREIAIMRSIHERLFRSPLRPSAAGHEALGLSADEAGMLHGDAAERLADANPFDRAFVDEMVGHHEGAVRMAEVVVDRTDDGQIRKLAETITEDQRREIAQMTKWRTRWYGDQPDAGAPDADGGHGGSSH